MSDTAPPSSPAGDVVTQERDRVQQAFGVVLRRLRDERGLSQEDLAAESGVGRTFIAKMETGRRQPTVTTVYRLSRALGLMPEDVITAVSAELGFKATG